MTRLHLYFFPHRLLPILATTVLLMPLPALGAKRPKPELCPDARYVQRDAVVPGGGSVETLVVGSTMSIASGCPPTKAKRKATKKGTRVTAAWRACTGLKGRATFAGMIANGCGALTGTFKAKKAKRTVKISAGKSTCGDGTHDPGAEDCDAGARCAAGQICDPATCTCVAEPTPPGGTNSPPVARFTAPLAGQVGTALSFDALGSSDPDGDALAYAWQFGDGTRGGTARLAHLFADAGTFLVTLTVADGRGGTATASQTLTIAPGPTATGTVAASGLVRAAIGGAALEGALVTVETGTDSGTTGADGRVTVMVPRGVPARLRISKPGYADQVRIVDVPAFADDAPFETMLTPRAPAQTLADAAAGGTLAGDDGARLTVPPGALVDAAGNPVGGAVQVSLTPVDPTARPGAFPGKFEGVIPSGTQGLLLSYGTVEYQLSQNGQPVDLKPGVRATIEIPSYASLTKQGPLQEGDAAALWSLDERTGVWVQEGEGTVVASAASPSGFALRAAVSHFTWWNHDDFSLPPYGPKPRCLVDTNADGVLEDLTGTGHCWHAGTGPEQPDDGFGLGAGIDGGTTAAILPRVPNFAAYQATPAAGGVALPIPADTDIVLRSTAKGGTLAGTTLLRGPANVTEDIVVVLRPTDQQPATPITLPWDASHPATVNVPQLFEFAGTAGARVVVTVTPLIGEVLLQRVGGPTVAMASGDLGQAFGFLNASLPATGQYRVIVTPASGQTFRLVARGLLPTQGTQVTLPVVRNESISQGDVDQFRFDGVQDTTPLITVERTGSSTAGGRVLLLAPDGQQIADAAFGATGASVFPTLPATGSYGIVVVSSAGGGGYRLSASTSTAGATPITIPHDASYALDTDSEADEYTFQGTPGDPVFVTVARTSGSTARGSVTLLAPGAGALAARDFNSSQGRFGVVLSQAGEFRIRVLAIARGGYRLQVARSGAFPLVLGTNPAAGATGVAPAAPITATFTGDIEPTSVVGSVTVTVPGFTVPGTSSATGPTVTFTPTEPLPAGVLVTVRLETTIRQVSPNGTLPAVVTYSFRTTDVPGAGSSLGEGSYATVAVEPGGGAVALFDGRVRPPVGLATEGVGGGRYTPGVGWDPPTLLRGGDSANVSVPRIAMNGSGNAVAVFLQEPGGGDITSHVYAAVYTPGGGFAAPERIENVPSAMGGTQNAGPEVAIDDAGNAVAAWFEDAPTHRLLGNRYVAGAGWGHVVELHPDPPGGTAGESVHVASNGTGTVAVGYVTGGKAWVRRYVPATGWVDALELGTANRPIRVGVDAAGNMLAVYRAGLQYLVRRFDADDGVWAAAIPLDASTLANTVDQHNVDLVMTPAGVATLVYSRTEPGPTFTVLVRRFTPDTGAGVWGAAVPIDGPSATEPAMARVRTTPTGAAIAAWWRGSSASVPVTRRYDPVTGWGAITPVSRASQPPYDGEPLAMNTAGQAILVHSVNHPANPAFPVVYGARIP